MTDYHINIFYSEEDGGYITDIPDLDSCSAFGNTAPRSRPFTNAACRMSSAAARDSTRVWRNARNCRW